jgi:UDP-N-acetylglucosamine 2-epimerase
VYVRLTVFCLSEKRFSSLGEARYWTENSELGANYLVGPHTRKIVESVVKIIQEKEFSNKLKLANPFGD